MKRAIIAYPHIKEACFQIALDNDGINRERSKEQWAAEFSRWIAADAYPPEVLRAVDDWLGTLSAHDLETVCCGEAGEVHELLKSAPSPTNEMLNRYFEEVC